FLLTRELKQEVPVTRSIRKWSDDADATLQDCFASCSGAGRKFQVFGVYITNKLSWSKHTKTVVKRAQQQAEKFWHGFLDPQLYSCTIESLLTGCITGWYGNCSASDHKALQRVVRTAQYIIGAKLPAIHDLYTKRCQRKTQKIVKDSSHPSHRLFSLLPHCKRYWSAKSRTKMLLNSFYLQAIRLLNNSSTGHPDYLR
uniref:Alkylated DNA repair protein AlkB homologue 8 N-terminal domain-containing protein n=1 Tax=Oncorhynchus tshawytscha TaxID=74940 RepID=A0AAZ3Q103_ONCTS